MTSKKCRVSLFFKIKANAALSEKTHFPPFFPEPQGCSL